MSVPSKPPSEVATLRTVERLVAEVLPPGWALRSGRAARGDGYEWTIVSPAGETACFAIAVKPTVAGRQLDELLEPLRRQDGCPLVAAGFLSPTMRDTLADRGVSYADTTGNLRLLANRPGLFVERQGATRDPWPADDTLRSLRGRAAGRALRALCDFRPPYGIRDLAGRAAVPLGSLSRTVELLDREGLVARGGRGEVVDLDWERALRRWTQDYDVARSNRPSYYLDPRGLAAVERKLTKAPARYAITGAAAAQRFAPIAPARQLAVYVDDPAGAADRLGLRPADAGANVVLIEPYDPVVFDRTTVADGLTVVAASQLAADLLTGPGREPAEGVELLGWMRTNESLWRG